MPTLGNNLLDEANLGQRLAALAADQPAQPANRAAAIAAKASVVRRRQRVTTVSLTVLALATAAAVGVPTLSSPNMAAGPAITPVSAWPDRSQPDHHDIADAGLQEWRQEDGHSSQGDVRWLYRGMLASAGLAAQEYVVVFAPGSSSSDVVIGHASIATGANGPVALAGSWLFRQVPLAAGSPQYVGAYVGNATNTVFVLAAPSARQVHYQVNPLPYAQAATARASTTRQSKASTAPENPLRSSNGVFIGDIGALTGPVDVSVADAAGGQLAAGPLAAGEDPQLLQPDGFDPDPELSKTFGEAAQAMRWHDGTFSVGGNAFYVHQPAGRWKVRVRCYGGGELSLSVRSYVGIIPETNKPSREGPTGAVLCDGAVHEPFSPLSLPAIDALYVDVTPSTLQAYVYEVGRTS